MATMKDVKETGKVFGQKFVELHVVTAKVVANKENWKALGAYLKNVGKAFAKVPELKVAE